MSSPPLSRLLKRADFLACAATGHKWVRPSFTLQLRKRPESVPDVPDVPDVRIGFTTTRKLGNAVVRNRIRRRLREAARLALPQTARAGHDYVIIGRPAAATINFEVLQQELVEGMRKLHHIVDKKQPAI